MSGADEPVTSTEFLDALAVVERLWSRERFLSTAATPRSPGLYALERAVEDLQIAAAERLLEEARARRKTKP